MDFRSVSVEQEPASSLLQAMRDEMAALYDDLDLDAPDMPKARLDTGPRQPHSQRLFRSAGYRPIANFNNNPVATFFGEKRL